MFTEIMGLPSQIIIFSIILILTTPILSFQVQVKYLRRSKKLIKASMFRKEENK